MGFPEVHVLSETVTVGFAHFHMSSYLHLCFLRSSVSLKVGIITCAAGIVGVWLGAEIAWRYRLRNRKADAIVCAVALLGSAPFLYGSLVLAIKNIKVTYVSTKLTSGNNNIYRRIDVLF